MQNFLLKAIGVPWVDRGRDVSGWDCWGLVVCFYKEVFGIDIMSYDGVSSSSENYVTAIRVAKRETVKWLPINPGQEQSGDTVMWRQLHCGIVINPGEMLHCLAGSETVVEKYRNNLNWQKERLIGFYRHAQFI